MVLWFWLRIIELSERDLWRSSSPILVQGKSNKNKLLRALSKWAFDTFRDRKPSTTLSSMFQCLMTLLLYFSCYLWIEFYLLQPRTLVPLSFCSTPLETSTKSFHFFLILTLNAPGPTAHLHRTCSSPQSPSWPSLHSPHYLSQTGESRTGPDAPVSPVLERRTNTFLDILATLNNQV